MERAVDGVVEWYENRADGLEQGWTISARPAGEGKVRVEVAIEGAQVAIDPDGHSATLTPSGARSLRYAGVRAWDAKGTELKAFLVSSPAGIAAEVDDTGAVYPVTVDPLVTSIGWAAESNQSAAQFGWAVASAGDVNGDGFGDVLVGANKYVPASCGTALCTNAGAAYLFLGSKTGISTTASWTTYGERSYAFYGQALAGAGDVNGDGYADVVVGAYGQTTPNANAGRVYIFHGSATGLAATAVSTLDELQANAKFGSAVAGAGDVNGDGYADVVVGAPGYTNTLANEGRASVFLGSASGVSAAASWATYGGQASALYGSAVAGAGDVNGDSYGDVVIGAPNYNTTNAFEGQARIYTGSATGVLATALWTSTTGSFGGANQYGGGAVAAAGDWDGDGVGDVMLGVGTSGAGRAYMLLGRSTAFPKTTCTFVTTASGFGTALSSLGDVNGDGYADVAVGQQFLTTNTGSVSVYLGSTACPAAAKYTVAGSATTQQFGASIAGGDYNGDGFGDLLVGAPLYTNVEANEGRALAFYGAPSGLSTAASNDISGGQANAQVGYSIASAGDVNGDGYPDLIAGAPYWTNTASSEGRVMVYYGNSTGYSATPSWTYNGGLAGAHLGWAVSGAGDVNGDGYGDVAVGAPDYNGTFTGCGRAYVFLGSASGLAASPVWTGEGEQATAKYGSALAMNGDLNADGRADLVVGAPNQANGSTTGAGRVYLFLGSASGPNPYPDWQFEKGQASAQVGSTLAYAGDVNADGYDDILVAAKAYQNTLAAEGAVWLFAGLSTGVPGAAAWAKYGAQANANLGSAVAGAGDVNGDGYSDVIVGAPNFDGLAGVNSGSAYVHLGSATGLSATAVWTAQGSVANATYGSAVASAGDVNFDGFADVLVGVPNQASTCLYANYNAFFCGTASYGCNVAQTGRVEMFLGSSTGPLASPAWVVAPTCTYQACVGTGICPTVATTNTVTNGLGTAIAPLGDINGDGVGDFAVSAPWGSGALASEGHVFVYRGNSADLLNGPSGRYAPRQLQTTGALPLPAGGKTTTSGSFAIRFDQARAPFPDTRARIEFETKPLGSAFTGLVTTTTPSWSTALNTPASLPASVAGLTAGAYHWRARLRYDLTRSASWPLSRWFYGGVSGEPLGTHVRVSGPVFPNGSACTTGIQCASAFCVSGTCCNTACNGGVCQACNLAGSVGTCSFLSAITVCRGASGECDQPETCPGTAATCPADIMKTSGTTCTSDGNPCTADTCNGSSNACQHPAGNAGAMCRAATGPCDVSETCSGISTACPADSKATVATVCRAMVGACDITETCDGVNSTCPADAKKTGVILCRASAGECDVAESCDGLSGACPADVKVGVATACTSDSNPCTTDACDGASAICQHPAGNAGTPCRATAGPCDVTDSCDGVATTCPADAKQPAGFACTTPGGECEVGGQCNGTVNTCPASSLKPAGTACSSDGNPCTADLCNGASITCQHPAGNSGAVCRPALADCDVSEACTGASTVCPADILKTSGTVCRASSAICDKAETCNGASAACPADGVQPAGLACRPVAGACDAPESCDGTNGQCPSDAMRPDGAECRASAGECDAAEACNGVGITCPTDVKKALGTGCPDDGNACTADECDGMAVGCQHPAGNGGTVCRASVGECDADESCSGTSVSCPADIKQPAGTGCADDTNPCTADTCNGLGTTCQHPAGNAGAVCRATVGTCDVEEKCSGTSTACPSDSKAVLGTVCRAATANCDVSESCDGLSAACPVDGLKPLGTACRTVEGVCDTSESCTGSNAECPTDTFLPAGTSCGQGSCTNGVETIAPACSGTAATCPVGQQQSCGAFSCDPGACKTTCSAGTDCVPGAYCTPQAICSTQSASGEACSSDANCISGHCTDGLCCSTACSGQCEACDVAGSLGTCLGVAGTPHGSRPSCATDGSSCGGTCNGTNRVACTFSASGTVCKAGNCSANVATLEAVCDGAGVCGTQTTKQCAPYLCVSANCTATCVNASECQSGNWCSAGVCLPKIVQGEACLSDAQCTTGICIDGVCCDKACGGQCEACDVTGSVGTCSPATGKPHGKRSTCASDGSACGGTCDGALRIACNYPNASVSCRAPSCTANVATLAASCNGAGACPAVQTQNCSPFSCGTGTCAGNCVLDTDCTSTAFCSAGLCQPKLGAGVACGGNSQCTSGFCIDGVCCNRACNGQCEACDVQGSEGQCKTIPSDQPHGGRTVCAGTGACQATCDGSSAVACVFPVQTTVCGAGSCTNGRATVAPQCDGVGECKPGAEQGCAPYACDTTSCKLSCELDTDCGAGFVCNAAKACVIEPIDAGADAAAEAADDAAPDAPEDVQADAIATDAAEDSEDALAEGSADASEDASAEASVDATTDSPTDADAEAAVSDSGTDSPVAQNDAETDGATPAVGGSEDPSSCGCRTPGKASSSGTSTTWIAMAAVGIVLARRIRRGKHSDRSNGSRPRA